MSYIQEKESVYNIPQHTCTSFKNRVVQIVPLTRITLTRYTDTSNGEGDLDARLDTEIQLFLISRDSSRGDAQRHLYKLSSGDAMADNAESERSTLRVPRESSRI